METEKLINAGELDSLVNRVWQTSKETILKQVEYSVAQELSERARSRARALIISNVDALIKPKLDAMKAAMEERARQVADRLLPKVEEAMLEGMKKAIETVAEYSTRQILSEAERTVRSGLRKALEG